MYVVCVTISVVPGQGDTFLAASKKNRDATRLEPGNVRFDICRQAAALDDGAPEGFFLFEVYRSEDDFTAHQRTEHYLAWRAEVEPLMQVPRQGARYVPALADPWE